MKFAVFTTVFAAAAGFVAGAPALEKRATVRPRSPLIVASVLP